MDQISDAHHTDLSNDSSLTTETYGIWTVLKERKKVFARVHPNAFVEQLWDIYRPCKRLYQDIFYLEPGYMCLYFSYKLWEGIEPVVLLYFTSLILNAIESSLKSRNVDVKGIGLAVIFRLLCVTLTSVLKYMESKYYPRFKSSVTSFYEERVFKTELRLDLPTSHDNQHSSTRDGVEAVWYTFFVTSRYIGSLVATLAHVIFVSQSPALSNIGLPFLSICLLQPVADSLIRSSWWHQESIIFTRNKMYQRMKSLQKLVNIKFKKDVLTGNLLRYVVSEHSQARESLKGTPTIAFWQIHELNPSMLKEIFLSLLSCLPMLYYATLAILNPSGFSMTTIAVLQQSHSHLQTLFVRIMSAWIVLHRQVGRLKQLYNFLDLSNTILDGELPYLEGINENSKGMGIELQNVSFAYPSKNSEKSALDNISLSIQPGSLVVVVGANGSGKSTLINIVTRLYDVTSGSVYIDSHPIQEYRLADLRKSTAVLTQDHQLFPLSIHENIALGNIKSVNKEDIVTDSARRGGASDVISKFKDGAKTTLNPNNHVQTHMNAGTDKDHPLNKALRALPKPAEVSGGEKQRLLASRLFMRFTTNTIRLVCVDEPSSALDPEAEFQLFNNLREARAGKTMIFVTHRFGHLARYADLILYMKDGKIAERGTHAELMKQNGNYAHQYNIQASAFVSQDNQA